MSNCFDYLAIELVIKIMKFMRIQDKEHFTAAFPQYYSLFKARKKRFLEENYQVNYRPLVKKGIEYYLENNKLCISAMLRKKKFYIDCFPEPLRRFFIDYNTPIIPYKCKFRSRPSAIFDCEPEDLKHKISVGKYPCLLEPKANRFIFIKTKDNDVISIWEKESHGNWDCYFGDLVHAIIGQYYVNFRLLENIVELL